MNSKQVVLITGSSTGFGRLFAETLARKGRTIFATMRDPAGRNAKNASEIRTLAEKDSLPIHVLELDVTDNASVERAADTAIAKAGRIDVAINTAGYYLSGLEEAVDTEQASACSQASTDISSFTLYIFLLTVPKKKRERTPVHCSPEGVRPKNLACAYTRPKHDAASSCFLRLS